VASSGATTSPKWTLDRAWVHRTGLWWTDSGGSQGAYVVRYGLGPHSSFTLMAHVHPVHSSTRLRPLFSPAPSFEHKTVGDDELSPVP
jgi:hypothetical protein